MRGRAFITLLVPGIAIVLLLGAPGQARGYSVLAHESAIDAAWDRELRPLLLRRFPRSTPAELERARSFAYGGSVIQDLGYYPFGNKFFSNLLHYARTGDFVESLVQQAQTLDELAFALGAMAHYANDIAGHPLAVNRSVPLAFPKLRAKFGDEVTYVQAPKQHVIVEFSFDVAQAARGRYSFTQYRTLLDFQVATALLNRAFHDTYGLEMSDLFGDEKRAISTYRFAVSQLIPALTEAAWRDQRDEILAVTPAAERANVVFVFRQVDYEDDYGRDYQKPARFARFLAWVYRLVPKVGPLKPLAFTAPTPEVDRLFEDSIARAHARFQVLLRQVRDGRLDLANTNFDTGEPAHAHDYALADETHAEWLEALGKRKFAGASPAVRRTLDAYYRNAAAPDPRDRKARKAWDRTQEELARLNP
ncbi:MAG TPA: zinc dependent phospholipase C family protein [Vicinamibacterales bacterium]|jgi:hypothetical protein|nr:zinc dependent phospholipase C family protein [Vicinamibacterales bacterium]